MKPTKLHLYNYTITKLIYKLKLNNLQQHQHEKHVHLLAWETVTKTKSSGGLGIRDTKYCNDALLINQAWCLWKNSNSLWTKFLKHKHLHNTEFLLSNSTTGSHSWKALLKGRELLTQGLKWIVGNGQNIKFWIDHWITLGLVCSLIQGPLLQHELENTVSNFIIAHHQWDLSLASIILP